MGGHKKTGDGDDGRDDKRASRGLLAFFETVMSWVVIAVVVVGGSTLAVTWQSSSIEFVGDDRMQVSRRLGGVSSRLDGVRADSKHGWMIIRSSGDEVPVSSQPILLRD